MTSQQINIAIAEACGWTYPCPSCFNNGYKDRWRTPDQQGCKAVQDLPSYCTDLNAMHEAEKTLRDDQWSTYEDHLHWALKERTEEVGDCESTWHATAHQRAHAFLLTLGLCRG